MNSAVILHIVKGAVELNRIFGNCKQQKAQPGSKLLTAIH